MNAKIVFSLMPLEFSTRQVQPAKPNKQFSKVYDELLQTLVFNASLHSNHHTDGYNDLSL